MHDFAAVFTFFYPTKFTPGILLNLHNSLLLYCISVSKKILASYTAIMRRKDLNKLYVYLSFILL